MARSKIIITLKDAITDPKTWLPIFVCSILMAIQFAIPFDIIRKNSREHQIQELNSEIDEFYKEFEKDKTTIYYFPNLDESSISKIANKNHIVQIYAKNADKYSLIFWSKRGRFFDDTELKVVDKNSLCEFSDGKFYLFKSYKKKDTLKLAYINLSELVSKYWDFKVKLVDKEIETHSFQLDTIEKNDINTYRLRGPSNQLLLSVKDLTEVKSDMEIVLLLLFYVLESLLLIFSLYNFCSQLARKYPWISFITLSLILYFSRWLSIKYKYPSYLYNLKLFSPSLYYSPLNPSLGDLLIFIVLMLIVINFFSRKIFLDINKAKKYGIAWLLHTIVLAFFFGEAISIIKVFERITLNSSIWFNFNYFPRITIYSLLGLSILLLSLYNYFTLLRKALKIISQLKTSIFKRTLSFLITFVVLITILIWTHQKEEMYVVISLLFLFVVVIYVRYISKNNRTFVTNIIFIIFASTITTYLIHLYNTKKEDLVLTSYASNVAFGSELNFLEKVVQKIKKTQITPVIEDSLYNIENIKIEPIESDEYHKLLINPSLYDTIGNSTTNCYLYKNINNRYGLIQVNKKCYRIMPNSYLNNLSSTIQNNINKKIDGENFVYYAKYINDTLVYQAGQYPFSYCYNYHLNKDSTIIESEDTKNFSNKVYFFSPHMKVIMSSYSSKPISPMTLFSYIICFNLIVYLVFSIVFKLIGNLIYRKKIKFGPLSLRDRINYFIILVIILIFSIVALMSYSYFRSKSEEDKKEYILNKLSAVQKFLQITRITQPSMPISLSDYIVKQLSYSNNVPITLYYFGEQFVKKTYDEKLSPKNEVDIDPTTFWLLEQKNNRCLRTFNLNQKKHFEASTIVAPFDSSSHCVLAISLANDSRVFSNDTTSFIVALVNIYVFLFIIALFLSFSLSNNITRPLKILSYKISKINIQHKNDHIEYDIDDEIGELVKKYNSMVDEIEESAKLLANNERENAWREMAKQIAHEIKNPLTPMKLSIQHLERVVTEQRENSIELTARVCKTVIEQIDNLSEIATSFSNFAKINNPKLEKVDIVSILRNSSDLFNNEETKSRVYFNSELSEAEILCDPHQLISCINNLIKNGLQASSEREEAIVNVQLDSSASYYRISIKDNGIGVPIEIRDKIFKPNFTTKNSGTGLGLAITKKFIEAMNGTIEFITLENVGTEFILMFSKEI